MSHPDIEQTHEQGQDRLTEIHNRVLRAFPQFTDMDRASYEQYDPEKDTTDTARWLSFFTEQGRDHAAPRLRFVYRRGSFVVNYANIAEPATPHTIWNPADSMYAPLGRRYADDQIDVALERAKIYMEGIDTNSEAFMNQLADWSAVEERFITMAEKLAMHKAFVAEGKTFKAQQKRMWQQTLATAFTLLDRKRSRKSPTISNCPDYCPTVIHSL